MVVGGWPALGAEGSRVIDRRVISDAHDGWVPRRLDEGARRLGVVAPAEPRTGVQPRPRRAEVRVGAAGASPSPRARIPRDPRGTGRGNPARRDSVLAPTRVHAATKEDWCAIAVVGATRAGDWAAPRHCAVMEVSARPCSAGRRWWRRPGAGRRRRRSRRSTATSVSTSGGSSRHSSTISGFSSTTNPLDEPRCQSRPGSGGALVLIMRLVVALVQGTPRRRLSPARCCRITNADDGVLHYDWYLSDDGTRCVVRETYADSGAALAHLPLVSEQVAKIGIPWCRRRRQPRCRIP